MLPEKDYTPEQLALIFQHEIIHLSRGDNHLKFTLILFSAFLWFHPLVWGALRICAADLELSCDEAVVYGRTPEERKAYASLLLDTKAEAQGFTTCLSASAKSLRYRLKNIVHPKKRIVGAIFVGLLCYGLLSVGMSIGLRFQPTPTMEQIFHAEELSQIEIKEVMFEGGGSGNYGKYTDRAILEYISDLSLFKTIETSDEDNQGFWIRMVLASPEHIYQLRLQGNYLHISTYNDGIYLKTDYYYLESQPAWELLIGYIIPK